MDIPSVDSWEAVNPAIGDELRLQDDQTLAAKVTAENILLWRFRGICPQNGNIEDQTLIYGWSPHEGPGRLWIGLQGVVPRLTVSLQLERGEGARLWRGPLLVPGKRFDLQVAIHTGMGPGGVMFRQGAEERWSSLKHSGATIMSGFAWPPAWSVGGCQENKPFRGENLQVNYKVVQTVLH